MKIAYQGLEGSFSELAAIKLAEQEGLAGYELLPVATSENVCHHIENGAADYGVVAIENSIGGVVYETKEALEKRKFEQIARVAIPISQCLYKLSPDIPDEQIKFVASHEQALFQCKNTISQIFPGIKKTLVEDTALAAQRLKEGIFKPDTAAICSKRAGELYNLCLIKEGVQDKSGNTTYFSLISKGANGNSRDNNKKDSIIYWLSKGFGLRFIIQAAIAIAIIVSYYLTSNLGWIPIRSAFTIGGPVAAFCIFLTSRHFRIWLDARRICGHWAYYVIPEGKQDYQVDQLEGLKRLIAIDIDQSEIHLKGWLCSSPVKVLFESETTLITPSGKKSGMLMYRYISSTHAPSGVNFNGIACLEFYETSGWEKVEKMSGWYVNRQGDMGTLEFRRIEKEEFDRWIYR
jgi:prephenate dehydratase